MNLHVILMQIQRIQRVAAWMRKSPGSLLPFVLFAVLPLSEGFDSEASMSVAARRAVRRHLLGGFVMEPEHGRHT